MSGRDDAGSSVFADRIAELRELARYLHDTVTQELVTLAFGLSYIESMALPDAARAEVESAQRTLDHCCREIRLIGAILAPSLADISLHSAVEQLAVFVGEETAIRITCEIEPLPNLPEESQVLVVTAVQCWLALPIRRRAEPEILIRLRGEAREVILELGMSPSPADAARGWTGLGARARSLGGTFAVAIESERLSARLSLPEGLGGDAGE